MSVARGGEAELSERARAWRTAVLESVCDVIEPWAHGTVYRATRYPSYFAYNLIRVQEPVSVATAELLAVAERALAGLTHRWIDFDYVENSEPLRHELESRGWRATRLLWLLHDGDPPAPDASGPNVEEVPYDAVSHLRVQWHQEDFPGIDPTAFHAVARELEVRKGARVLATCRDGQPVAFAQLDCVGSQMEIGQVYVHAEHRGLGLGTAVTTAAIREAVRADELWICADDEDRAKHLYARLGFRPAWTTMEFLRMPLRHAE